MQTRSGIVRRLTARRSNLLTWLAGSALTMGTVGCAAGPPRAYGPPSVGVTQRPRQSPDPLVVQASYQEPAGKPAAPVTSVPVATAGPLSVDELVRLAVERHPRLAKATFAVDAAHGRQIQAGLYPNPVFSFTADELCDRTGPGGILTPQLSQEIVRGGKLQLSQAAAAKEVDQAALDLMAERYTLIGAVRAAFYEAYALEERGTILRDLLRINETIAARTAAAKEAGGATGLDVVQLEVETERVRAEAKSVEQELPAALRRLATVAGLGELPPGQLTAPFDVTLPAYDLDAVRSAVTASHPLVQAARAATERAALALRRAQAEPVPNVTVSAGYTRQNQNRSNDWGIGVSLPLPVWNKNQGNVKTAAAELAAARAEVGRAENELAERTATTFRTYAAARQRADWYKTNIMARAEKVIGMLTDDTLKPRGNVTILQVIQAQRTLAEARLEYNKSLGEAWRAAAELSALSLEESWPPPVAGPAPPAAKSPSMK